MSNIFLSVLEQSLNSGKLLEIIKNSLSLKDVTKYLGYSDHGRYTGYLRKFCISKNIDLSHFTGNGKPPIEYIEKICPQCKNTFFSKHLEKKQTCSHSCANKFFAFKQGGKNKKHGNTTYVAELEKYFLINQIPIVCCVCGINEVLDVHHVDEDRYNNEINNLVFLCPNHHALYHRRKDEVVIEAIIKDLDYRL